MPNLTRTTPAPPAVLPPPGPALTLHQAAAKLRAAAEATTADMIGNPFWKNGWQAEVDGALGGPSGVLCGLLSPELALDVADWLDATAVAAVKHAAAGRGNIQEEITDGHPTTMAQRILEAA